jgi:hypothetical protein
VFVNIPLSAAVVFVVLIGVPGVAGVPADSAGVSPVLFCPFVTFVIVVDDGVVVAFALAAVVVAFSSAAAVLVAFIVTLSTICGYKFEFFGWGSGILNTVSYFPTCSHRW